MKEFKKVFISVPMRGREPEAIQNDIDRVKAKIQAGEPDIEFEFIDNFIDPPTGDAPTLYCLGEAIKKLGDCDIIFMCKGWWDAPGCLSERFVAERYDIEVWEEM